MATRLRFDLRQLLLPFGVLLPPRAPAPGPPPQPAAPPAAPGPEGDPLPGLEARARVQLRELGLDRLDFRAVWNPRMRSCAGRAYSAPPCRIELNPRLRKIAADEVERTFWHELAHVVAHARAGRRRIEPHGPEWRRACADLGIPNESVTHRLPLPRRQTRWRLHYVCPGCGQVLPRVRPIRRRVACLACCRIHNRGRFDPRFQFQRIPAPPQAAAGEGATGDD
jgi:SprT protein